MMLYYKTQATTQTMFHKNQNSGLCSESSSFVSTESQQATEQISCLICPKKPSNPILDSPTRRTLHRELLVSHRRGLLPEEKPELQRVLEQRRLEQEKERERSLQPPSDLEQELSKRRQKLTAHEEEELKSREHLQNTPEFVRVKDKLRHISISGC